MRQTQVEEDEVVIFPDPEIPPPEEVSAETIDGKGSDDAKAVSIRAVAPWLIMVFVMLLTMVTAYYFLSAPRASANTATRDYGEQRGSGITLSPDQVSDVSIELVQKHSVSGEVKSPGKVAFNGNQITPVLSQFSGRIVKLTAEVGGVVRSGQILGVIESPDIVQPQSDYQLALANERTARTSLLNATRTRERAERLVKVEAIPLRELQQAQLDENHAREDLERAQQAIAAGYIRLQSLHFSDADIRSLESSGILRREVPITAPIDGTVIERKSGLGQVVQPGGDPLFQIANLSTVWVNAEVYEDQLAKLHVGFPATVESQAYPNEHFIARVDQIGSTVDIDKRTVAVRCVLPNGAGKLKPGMFVNVSLGGVSSQNVITIPTPAVVTQGDKRVVFVETSPGNFEKREVILGNEQGDSVVVRSGLKEGEKVVVKGGILIAASGENAA